MRQTIGLREARCQVGEKLKESGIRPKGAGKQLTPDNQTPLKTWRFCQKSVRYFSSMEIGVQEAVTNRWVAGGSRFEE